MFTRRRNPKKPVRMAPPDRPPDASSGGWSYYNPTYAERAAQLAELGATEIEIARALDVPRETFQDWIRAFPELEKALKLGKDAADERVTRSLYHRAIGYTYTDKDGDTVHMPPDTTACIFWLKNRRRDLWRDKYEIDQEHRHLHLHVAEKFREYDDERIFELLAERRLIPTPVADDAPASSDNGSEATPRRKPGRPRKNSVEAPASTED